MTIALFDKDNAAHKRQAAHLLEDNFHEAYGDCAQEEVEECLQVGKIAIAALEKGQVIGFAGAMPHYDGNVYEIHPVVVDKAHQGRGIGRAMLSALEAACAQAGAVTLYLGCDDEFGETSLAGCDIYDELHERIQNIQNFKGHPFTFYEKCGFQIVGVVPDANGYGKPDIMMAKRVGKAREN